MLMLLFLLPMLRAEVQIHNYTDSYVVTIANGYGKIQDGSFKFIHPINLESYYDCLYNTKKYVDKNILKTNPLYPTMYLELNQSLDLLATLRILTPQRNVRSIDTLGKIWKLIAGSPDHDDAELIYKTLNEIADNTEKQMIINTDFANRLNNITGLVNDFSNAIRKDEAFINEEIEILRNKVRLIKETIVNIKYAIQWAKNNIINSFLLNKEEMTIAIEKLKKENMPFNNIEEALELANVNILSNNTNLLYIIKIPLTNPILYNNIIVKPIIKNDSIINLTFKQMFVGENEIYAINNNCLKYNKIEICKRNQIIDLSKDKCIKNIMANQRPTCTTSNIHHVQRIEEISEGLILLNNVNETIRTESMRYELSGTFLIRFDNTTIKINEKVYKNLEASYMTPIPAIIQESPIEEKRLNLLSLESLQELHLKNIKIIHRIRRETWVSNATISIAFLITLSLTLLAIRKAKNKKLLTTVIVNPETEIPAPKDISPTSTARLHNLPYF
ncbi:uncharacterized protein LOC128864340 [Anastrepha ludens]|uniref:uncharacterized protein LOC128864340 n=1 Tax=Anastrepha ludens TaxID=28586 RepID=UPI0023B1202C|nr:uncharacterized protein LOC128864340 [Anastrepha ludens]